MTLHCNIFGIFIKFLYIANLYTPAAINFLFGFVNSDAVLFFSGEVERLLREFTQNQEMVRNIGTHYYQIIYPVQLRQHKKMGISTREIGSSKVRIERSTVCHCTFHLILHTLHSFTIRLFHLFPSLLLALIIFSYLFSRIVI